MVSYRNIQHPSTLISQVNDFRRENLYTDVVIETSDGEFPAHRIVLAASGCFWSGMFRGGFTEAKLDRVNLKNMTSHVFSEILLYMYTGQINVKLESVVRLYEAGDYLQLDFITDSCISFMLGNVTSDNYLDFLKSAETYTIINLKKRVLKYICDNFGMLCGQSNFYDIPFGVVCDLLARNDLLCNSEATIVEIAARYMELNQSMTHEDKLSLVGFIRYGLIGSDISHQLHLLNDFIEATRVKEMQSAILEYNQNTFSQPLMQSYWFKPRRKPQLLIMGGMGPRSSRVNDEGALDTVTVVNLIDNVMVENNNAILKLPEPLFSFATVLVGKFMFVLGGGDSRCHAKATVHRYNICNNEWLALENMMCARKKHEAALVDDCIIVVGGDSEGFWSDGEYVYSAKSSVESYNIASNEWRSLNDFPKKILCAASACANGTVYRSGGGEDDLEIGEVYATIYRYDSAEDVWYSIGRLNEPLWKHTMCCSNNKLYVFGGQDEERINNDIVSCFDLRTNQCLTLGTSPRSVTMSITAKSVVFEEEIYVMNGPREILIYNISNNTWRKSSSYQEDELFWFSSEIAFYDA